MEIVALTVYGVALVAAFGWRTVRQWHRTGRSGWVGVRRSAGPVAAVGGLLFVAALLVGVVAVIAPVAGAVGVFSVPVEVTGLGLGVAGVGLAVVLVAQAQMGLSWRIGVDPAERTALVTGGLFRWVRNPVFTGMVAVQVGVALMCRPAGR